MLVNSAISNVGINIGWINDNRVIEYVIMDD